MKKILFGLFVFSLLLVGLKVSAVIVTSNDSAMCPLNGSPFITVVSPNGGETYQAGQQITVGWVSCNIPVASDNSIDIILHGYDSNGVIVYSKELSTLTLNDGYEVVTLPTNLGGMLFGKNFAIAVGTDSTNNPSTIFDYSDDKFTINPIIETKLVPSITVTSPNSGFESIESGQKIEIRWDSNVSINALVDVYVSDGIHKGAVVRGNNNGSAGLIYTLDSSLIPGSNYKAYVSLVSETPVSDSSDNSFTIRPKVVISPTDNPVIYEVSGPQILKIGEVGKWEVKASNLGGGTLTYSVIWGDEAVQTSYSTATRQISQQSATFTHTFNQVGAYNPTFVVTSGNGKSANTSISVNVNNSTNICPVGCVCDGQMTTCPIKPIETNCRPGYKFDPNTGAACPTETLNDGCRPGFKFSPMTGLACPEVVVVAGSDNNSSGGDHSNKGLIKRTLKVGTKGDDVKIIQALLGLIADGAFGPATKAKVMEWQAAHGLTSDGSFGPMSRRTAGLED